MPQLPVVTYAPEDRDCVVSVSPGSSSSLTPDGRRCPWIRGIKLCAKDGMQVTSVNGRNQNLGTGSPCFRRFGSKSPRPVHSRQSLPRRARPPGPQRRARRDPPRPHPSRDAPPPTPRRAAGSGGPDAQAPPPPPHDDPAGRSGKPPPRPIPQRAPTVHAPPPTRQPKRAKARAPTRIQVEPAQQTNPPAALCPTVHPPPAARPPRAAAPPPPAAIRPGPPHRAPAGCRLRSGVARPSPRRLQGAVGRRRRGQAGRQRVQGPPKGGMPPTGTHIAPCAPGNAAMGQGPSR